MATTVPAFIMILVFNSHFFSFNFYVDPYAVVSFSEGRDPQPLKYLERKRGLKTRVNRIMFILTLFMYTISAAYWAFSVADVVDRMQSYIRLAVNPLDIPNPGDAVLKWSPLFNAISLINVSICAHSFRPPFSEIEYRSTFLVMV